MPAKVVRWFGEAAGPAGMEACNRVTHGWCVGGRPGSAAAIPHPHCGACSAATLLGMQAAALVYSSPWARVCSAVHHTV